MRGALFVSLLLALFLSPRAAPALALGDAGSQVRAELGNPLAYVRVNGFEVFEYERGRVEVRNGNVSLVELMSQEEAEALAREKAAAEAARVLRERELSAQREKEGLRVLQERLSDPDFLGAPPSARIAAWKRFRQMYPEVPLPDDFTHALQERQQELEASRTAERVAELERRVAQAETRADLAERERWSAPTSYSTSGYLPVSYPIVYGGGTYVRIRGSDDCGKATVRPYPSTPGYGFQRPIRQPRSSITCAPKRPELYHQRTSTPARRVAVSFPSTLTRSRTAVRAGF